MQVHNARADANASRIAAALHVEAVPGRREQGDRGRWKHPETGEAHRLDGPAIDQPGRYQAWYIDGLRHNLDGPAVWAPQQHAWWVNGVMHRLDGPALVMIETDETKVEWWVNGVPVEAEADVTELGRLYDAREVQTLEMVLRLWRPDGPSVIELLNAVRAAAA